MRYNKLNTS